jgi:glycosyltransferase involved in cell wall biosynthesis
VVLSVGRLDEDKGHVFLVRALQRVLEDVPGVRLIIAGEGPERKNLEETARELQIDERIRLCGFVRNPAPLYELADVAVFPSLPGYESFCNAALEAMSFGLPVVATGCGGFPELIADGESGLLVPCGDAERIAEALLRLDRDEELRNRIGGAGRAVVMREFSPESRTEELESFLMRILEG